MPTVCPIEATTNALPSGSSCAASGSEKIAYCVCPDSHAPTRAGGAMLLTSLVSFCGSMPRIRKAVSKKFSGVLPGRQPMISLPRNADQSNAGHGSILPLSLAPICGAGEPSACAFTAEELAEAAPALTPDELAELNRIRALRCQTCHRARLGLRRPSNSSGLRTIGPVCDDD